MGASKRLMLTGTNKIHSGFIKMTELNRIDFKEESIIIEYSYKFLFENKRLEKFKKAAVSK